MVSSIDRSCKRTGVSTLDMVQFALVQAFSQCFVCDGLTVMGFGQCLFSESF